MCGKCVVVILNGDQYLSKPTLAEANKLQQLGSAKNERLGCQLTAPEGAVVEITTGYW